VGLGASRARWRDNSVRSRPRLLDLFCGAGGAAVGYHLAGFDVVGVDIKPQPRYPFLFVLGDALRVNDYLTWWDFDAIHASPPCQGYTTMANRHGSDYPKLIGTVRDALQRWGGPYVIENVPGARREMIDPIRLYGEQFALRVHRPRLFESNIPFVAPPKASRQRDVVAVYGKNDGRRVWTRKDGTELRVANIETAKAGMGIDWMTWDELREAIPPAYTEHIGRQLIAHIAEQAGA
jgi:DNA (cytosine-5)-methyltransferase 1